MSNHAVFILSAYLAALVILGGLTIASLSARNRVRRELAARGLRKKQAMTPKRKRLWLLVGSLGVLGVAAALVLTALNDNSSSSIRRPRSPRSSVPPERHFRLGGLVEAGSVKKNGQEVRFTVTDTHKTVAVVYRGLLPDLFREGQGVVAEGSLGADGVFTAREVLAKHDENYMPPEVAKAIKEAGQWRDEEVSVMLTERASVQALAA